MGEHTAAIVVALITGLFGFAGVVVTQVAAKWRISKMVPSEEAKQEALQKNILACGYNQEYMANLYATVRENGVTAREGIAGIKESMVDMQIQLRGDYLSLRSAIAELSQKLV